MFSLKRVTFQIFSNIKGKTCKFHTFVVICKNILPNFHIISIKLVIWMVTKKYFKVFGYKSLKNRKKIEIFWNFLKNFSVKIEIFQKLMYKNAIKMLGRAIFERFYQIFGVFISKNMVFSGFQSGVFFRCFEVPLWCFRP